MNFTWLNRGVFGDRQMPEVNREKMLAMGVRISPEIDISPALTVIDKIRSGRISYFARPLNGTEIIVFSSLDGGVSWNRLMNGAYLKDAERLNGYPFVRLKYVIKSYISQLQSNAIPELYQINVELSDKPLVYWEKYSDKQMEWSGGI